MTTITGVDIGNGKELLTVSCSIGVTEDSEWYSDTVMGVSLLSVAVQRVESGSIGYVGL